MRPKRTVKKKDASDYTERMRQATLEFAKRNEKISKQLEDLKAQHGSSIIEECIVRPAAVGARILQTDEILEWDADVSPLKQGFLFAYGCTNLDTGLKLLTWNHPESTLLLGIDLTKPKEVILEEIAQLLDIHLPRKSGRNAWLNKYKEYLEVWESWENAGQHYWVADVSRKLKRPKSTVRSQWQRAYELIHRRKYDPDEYKPEAQQKAFELCAKCKDATKCFRVVNGTMEQVFCREYLRLAGKEKSLREYLIDNPDLYSLEE